MSMVSHANADADAPPATASSVLSVSSCRTSRPRPAPSAARIASSRSRPSIRASVRLATFAQAISSTSPVMPSRISSSSRAPLVSASRTGTVRGAEAGGLRAVDLLWLSCVKVWQIAPTALAACSGDGARLQPAEHVQRAEGAAVLRDLPLAGGAERARQHRHVDVVLLRIVRHVRQHADHAMRAIVHLEHLADDVRIAAELRAASRCGSGPAPLRRRAHRLTPRTCGRGSA